MKISQMTTEQASDVLVRIMKPITNILRDKEAAMIMESISIDAEMEMEGIVALLMKVVPYCLAKHRSDTYEIVGALSGKTEKQIAKQNVLVTIRDITDSMDKDLVDFFKSYAQTGSGTTEQQE